MHSLGAKSDHRLPLGMATSGSAASGAARGTGLTARSALAMVARQGRNEAPAAKVLSRSDMAKQSADDDKKGRSRTIPARRLTRAEINEGIALSEYMDYRRPMVRSECREGVRPCPFVACKHHLYLDVNPTTGSIKINFPDMEVWEMSETCALDIAERGGLTLEEVGAIMNLTRERIRQVEVAGLEKLQAEEYAVDLEDVFGS